MKHKKSLWLVVAAGLATAAPQQGPHVNVIGLLGERAILRIDGEQVVLKPGEVRNGVTLLKVESGEAVLRVGPREVRLGMGMDTGGIAAPDTREASVELLINAHGQFVSNGTINGRIVQFLVDTGANTVSMNAQEAKRLGIDYLVDGKPGASSTAGGVVRSWGVTLKSVSIGPIVLKNVEANVREANDDSPILLGMTFLSRVSLQQEKNRLKLTAR